ncbi:hypothetical protein E2C01_058559 [Portunus trituberculatus]|uniref:Uncharacterized protein n=1 Tax=Portunus trituberculatus TaxID=210409 RepID=A0A5B7H311_PORTR|nr:hypothetical protein [Portunus trituberculatus]
MNEDDRWKLVGVSHRAPAMCGPDGFLQLPSHPSHSLPSPSYLSHRLPSPISFRPSHVDSPPPLSFLSFSLRSPHALTPFALHHVRSPA